MYDTTIIIYNQHISFDTFPSLSPTCNYSTVQFNALEVIQKQSCVTVYSQMTLLRPDQCESLKEGREENVSFVIIIW